MCLLNRTFCQTMCHDMYLYTFVSTVLFDNIFINYLERSYVHVTFVMDISLHVLLLSIVKLNEKQCC